MFWTVRLSIIRSLFTVHSAVVCVIQLSSRSICSCSEAVYKPVWHIPLLSVQWINSWWWTEELSETCRVSCQNNFCEIGASSWFYYKEICTFCFLVIMASPWRWPLCRQKHAGENIHHKYCSVFVGYLYIFWLCYFCPNASKASLLLFLV
jgi:hypothetical protein